MHFSGVHCLLFVIFVGSLHADIIYPEVGKTGLFEHPTYCNLYLEITTRRCPDGQLFDTTTSTCISKGSVNCNARLPSDCYPYGVDGCTTYPGANDRKCCPLVQNGVEKTTKCVSLTKPGGGYRTTCYPA